MKHPETWRSTDGASGGEFAAGVVVGNEFAAIEVSVDSSSSVRRVVLRDPVSGQARFIDPLVLQALIYLSDEEMQHLADPNLVVASDGPSSLG